MWGMGPVFLLYGCRNKLPKISGLKQCLIYSPAVHQVRKLTQVSELKSRCLQWCGPSRGPRGEWVPFSSPGYRDHLYFLTLSSISAVPNLFDTRDQFCRRQLFHGLGGEGWFQDDSRALHLLCTCFLSKCHCWSDRRYWSAAWRLGTPAKASHTGLVLLTPSLWPLLPPSSPLRTLVLIFTLDSPR